MKMLTDTGLRHGPWPEIGATRSRAMVAMRFLFALSLDVTEVT